MTTSESARRVEATRVGSSVVGGSQKILLVSRKSSVAVRMRDWWAASTLIGPFCNGKSHSPGRARLDSLKQNVCNC